jgi:hypothetical protein
MEKKEDKQTVAVNVRGAPLHRGTVITLRLKTGLLFAMLVTGIHMNSLEISKHANEMQSILAKYHILNKSCLQKRESNRVRKIWRERKTKRLDVNVLGA